MQTEIDETSDGTLRIVNVGEGPYKDLPTGLCDSLTTLRTVYQIRQLNCDLYRNREHEAGLPVVSSPMHEMGRSVACTDHSMDLPSRPGTRVRIRTHFAAIDYQDSQCS